jgi:hypothetical protein
MKTLFTLLAVFLISTGLYAQKFIEEWWEPIPDVPYHSEAKAIMITDDNKLFIAGPTHENWDKGNMFYAKTDTAGNIIWLTYAEEQFGQWYQCPRRLMTDVEGNLNMIGDYPVVYNLGTYYTKLSPSGELLSSTVNGGEGDYEAGFDMEQTTDSGFLVAAYKSIYQTGPCLALRKLDNTGHFIWDTLFALNADTNCIPGIFYGMDKVDDSTFVLTGKRDYAYASAEDLDILFAKVRVYDDSVRFLNFTVYEGEYDDTGSDILTLPDNQGYVICGTGPNDNNPTYSQGIIMRVDTAGNMLWRETYTRHLMVNTNFYKIHLNADNDILVLAQSGSGSIDPTLLKYSLDGDFLQKKHFDQGANEPVYDFTIDQDGKIYILATTSHDGQIWASVLKVKDICPLTTPEASLSDTILTPGSDVVVSVAGTNENWSYSLIQINGQVTLSTFMGNGNTLELTAAGLTNEDVSEGLVVSVIEPQVDCIEYSDTLHLTFFDGIEDRYQQSLHLIPNPAHDFITISDDGHRLSELLIFDVKGRQVSGKTELSSPQQINISTLTKGIYFFRISYKNGESVFRKIVKN